MLQLLKNKLFITLSGLLIAIPSGFLFYRYGIYSSPDTYVSGEVIEVPTKPKHGLGTIKLTPPPRPNPPIFKIDLNRTPETARLDLNKLPAYSMFQADIEFNINSDGFLTDPNWVTSTNNREIDDYILNRIRNWVFTSNTAEGRIRFIVRPQAGEAIIRLDPGRLHVFVDRIARGPHMGLFVQASFSNGIKVSIGG